MILPSLTLLCCLAVFSPEMADSVGKNDATEILVPDSTEMGKSADSVLHYHNPQYSKVYPKRWWAAGAEVIAVNVGNQLINRYVFDFDHSHISSSTIRNNLKRGLLWDNDDLVVNQIGHPYQGSFYYGAARANGLNYWQSLPFTVLGSLSWEFLGESDPPSINDVITTPIGSAAIGELEWRLSDLILDDSKRGFQRFWREAAAFVINPMRGLNRIFLGDAWRLRSTYYKYHDSEMFPVRFAVGAGFRHLNSRFDFAHGTNNLQLHFGMEYGDAFGEENTRPYDYFLMETKCGLFGNQPIIEQFSILGRMYGKMVATRGGNLLHYGVYQHFNYYDSNDINGGDDVARIPYKVSETASFGPGVILKVPLSHNSNLLHHAHLSGVALGAVKSDHFNVMDRCYNFGSGYSVKWGGKLQMGTRTGIGASVNHYHLFTWKDYSESYVDSGKDLRYLSSQGNRSNTMMDIARLTLSQSICKNVTLLADGAYYYRTSRYKSFERVWSHSFEICTSLMFHFP